MDPILNRFGYDAFREGQQEVISALEEGHDAIAILPTGNGKSFIYQYIGIKENCRVVIVSPLIALMVDQVASLKQLGIHRAVAITSLMSESEKNYILSTLNEYQFIFVSPEMLQAPRFFKQLSKLEIGLLVVDEAHCISQWGYDFRSDYLFIGKMRKSLGSPRTLALTATATTQVIHDIYTFLELNKKETTYFQGHAFLKNREIDVISVEGLRSKMLSELLKRVEYPCIVYASTIKEIEGLKESLQEEGFTKIDTFHSKRHSSDRQTIQQKFLRGELNILLATSAFGMGINQSNIRTIIHYQLPQTLEDYVQQIGRAGRDLQFSRCIALVHPDDFPQMRRKIERSYEVDAEEETELHQNIKEIVNAFRWNNDQTSAFIKKQRERKLKQAERIEEFATTTLCKELYLAQFFGEKRKDSCGKCSSCRHLDLFLMEITSKWNEVENSKNSFEESFKKLFNL
ncbi:RecQ family ATP-dependent DNA helicase [uncultured Granulicatella sp.]|uniref:RecQ family ATP-dependent DNA helicase n=1 Tax=uncultured Granulicatella sp. TaxID=316089 RepID=UPI00259A826B|nr:RecQ family ATP-dependent DNA helicase [uncultured Granulicatella sp.]